MNSISVPYLPYNSLREKAQEFFSKYYPSQQIPIPIENIVELKLGINIVPMPGLQKTLGDDGFGVVGFISSDLKDITVDEQIWHHHPARYRFTLAHEIGHYILHRDLYNSDRFDSIDSWKTFVNSIPDKDHGFYEWQAYSFAGLILVPERLLSVSVKRQMCEIKVLLETEEISENVWDFINEKLAKEFEVSVGVIQRRIEFDKLKDISQQK